MRVRQFVRQGVLQVLGAAAVRGVHEGADRAVRFAVFQDGMHPVFHRHRRAIQPVEEFTVDMGGDAEVGALVDGAILYRVMRAVGMLAVDDVMQLASDRILVAVETQHAQEPLVAKQGGSVFRHGVKTAVGDIEQCLQLGFGMRHGPQSLKILVRNVPKGGRISSAAAASITPEKT